MHIKKMAQAVGVCMALLAQQAGAKVTIYAEALLPKSRSARATGSWTPSSRIALEPVAGPAFALDGVLVGAGDSASDCISVALRQGCRSITQLIRKPRTEQTEKRDHAHEEAEAVFGADIRRYETQIERLVCGDDGSVNAVILQGSGEQLPCDLLLLASGFSGCEPASVDAYEAVRKTGVPALTAGDMASGASLVVLAIASGKQAAAQADASLMGYTNIL